MLRNTEKVFQCFLNKKKHWKGFSNGFLIGENRFLAVADYHENKDPVLFREDLRKALSYLLILSEAPHEAPEKKFFREELSELSHVMDSLAVGDLGFTRRMMDPYKDLTYKRMTPLMGYLHFFLSGFLYGTPAHFKDVLEEAEMHWSKRLKSYVGYSLAFKAIYEEDSEAFVDALTVLLKGHKRLCHPFGIYGGTEDEVIAIWPLGVANLARLKGLTFDFNHPLLPRELIIAPS